MIEINLLPEERRKKESRFNLKKFDLKSLDLKGLPIAKIAMISAGVLISFHILLFIIGMISSARIASLSEQYNKLLPQKKEADALKEASDAINKKVRAIDELMVKRFSWARKLNDLSDSMTPGIWLANLSYDEKLVERTPQQNGVKVSNNKAKKELPRIAAPVASSRYLIISGYASRMGEEGTALVGKFIKSLKDNSGFYSDFSGIELGSIKSERIEDLEVMNFKITCLFKE